MGHHFPKPGGSKSHDDAHENQGGEDLKERESAIQASSHQKDTRAKSQVTWRAIMYTTKVDLKTVRNCDVGLNSTVSAVTLTPATTHAGQKTWTDLVEHHRLACQMQSPTLIISDPPHEDLDPALAAPCFGLSPAEVRMKANYPIPEVWLTDSEGVKLDPAADILRTAGLNIVSVPGRDLAEIPQQTMVKSFAFTDTGLTLNLEDSQVDLSHDQKLVAVFCQPRPGTGGSSGIAANPMTEGLRQRRSGVFMARDTLMGFGTGTRPSLAGVEEENAESPFLDIYVPGKSSGAPPLRLALVQDQVDFSGLGDLKLPRAADNMVMFVAELEDRFSAARVDRRLVGMQRRSRAMVSKRAPISGERKGFSFATAALSQLLESLSPDLKAINQFDLASRLAYLTDK